ncbi:hypothetical protein P7C70_g131, partial [Phenoliferia sp. Uapishka_3]
MTPREVRGRITGLFQITVAIGVAISYWITYGFQVHFPGTTIQWRFPIAFQLIPSFVMLVLLFFIVESPRWLIYKGRDEEAIVNMAWARKRSVTDSRVQEEIAEITAAIKEEQEATSGASIKEVWAIKLRQTSPRKLTRAHIGSFCITKITPTLVNNLPNGRLFFLFAAINVLGAAFGFWLPETAGVSIEDMDVLFGMVTREERDRYIAAELEKRQAQMQSVDTEGMAEKGEVRHIEF